MKGAESKGAFYLVPADIASLENYHVPALCRYFGAFIVKIMETLFYK